MFPYTHSAVCGCLTTPSCFIVTRDAEGRSRRGWLGLHGRAAAAGARAGLQRTSGLERQERVERPRCDGAGAALPRRQPGRQPRDALQQHPARAAPRLRAPHAHPPHRPQQRHGGGGAGGPHPVLQQRLH